MRRNPVILQISDLHFGKSVNPVRPKSGESEEAKQALEAAVMATRPDFIVVTGDLSNGGRVEDLLSVKTYLENLLDRLWADKQATRCIVIPGNHDVWRTTAACWSGYIGRRNRLAEFDEAFPERSFISASVPTSHAVHITPQSLVEYYQKQGGVGGGTVPRAKAEQLDREARHYWEVFPSFQLAFLKLDSNIKPNRWKPGHVARGLVGISQRSRADKVMHDYERATECGLEAFTDTRFVALVHHHVTRLPNVKLEDWMLMDDAGEVARWLARIGVRLVLHGHFHRADLVGLTYWNTETAHSKMETIVVSAGSATARGVDDGHNSCHHIELEHCRTHIRRPLLDNGEFQPLAAAAAFEFTHKSNLTIDEGIPDDFPVMTDGLQISMEGGERYADKEHTYARVDSEAYIDRDRNYHGYVVLEGINEAGRATNYIPFTFTSAGLPYFDDCHCQAVDLGTGGKLNVELMERRPLRLFPCRVYFAAPLAPGGKFQIAVSFRLEKVMLVENDYDMLSLLRFSRGVSQARTCILAEQTIVAPTLMEVRGGKLVPSPIPLIQTVKKPASGATQAVMKGFEATISSPTALSYLLLYRKLV